VTTYDARDIRVWSGIPFHMSRAVERRTTVEYIGSLRDPISGRVLAGEVANRLRGTRAFRRERNEPIVRSHARQISARLRNGRAKAVLSPGTIPLAHLESELPRVSWTDATFAQLVSDYAEYRVIDRASVRAGHRLEEKALARSDALIYSSEWAAVSAIERYGADPEKVHVVPFGANLVSPTDADVADSVDSRSRDRWRLLFIGSDWERKGGAVAVEAFRRVRASAPGSELIIVGAKPSRMRLPEGVRFAGFLDKRRRDEDDELRALLASSHVVLVPSRADCTPIAICEAFAFGVPVVAAAVGGIPSMIGTGTSATLLPPSAEASDYADAVSALLGDPEAYRAAALAARAEHVSRLSWDVGAGEVVRILQDLVEGRPAGRRVRSPGA
jgi:glycosyltransferase involved in cell wall biosynthesis